jgi:hypothetical protein
VWSDYPIKVTIEAELDGDLKKVWSGRQQDLFAKNRHAAVPHITAALQKLKASM